MTTVNCDDPLARCEMGNLFRVNSPSGGLLMEGVVNGEATGILPSGERMILPNTLTGTTNRLDVILNGTTYPVCSRLQEFTYSRPQDLGVLLSEIDENAKAGGQRPEQEILVLQAPPSLSLDEGEIDVDTAPDDVLLAIARAILVTLEIIDEISGAQDLYESSGHDIDLRMTGTDGAPAIAEVVAAVRSMNGRRAIRALVDGGKGALRVARDSSGALVIVARMKPGIGRQLMTGVVAAMTRSRLAQVVTATRGNLRTAAVPSAEGAASKLPVVGWFIVGTIDFVEWYGNPQSRGDWSLLLSTLTVDGIALGISAIAAEAVISAVAIAFGGAAALTLGTAAIVVAAGIGTGLAVGMVLTWIANRWDLGTKCDQLYTAIGNGLEAIAQGAVEVTGDFADYLMLKYDSARQWAGDTAAEAGRQMERAADWTAKKAGEAADWASEAAQDTADWASESAHDVADWAVETAEGVEDWANETADDIREGWNVLQNRAAKAVPEGWF
ncbi:hypothetical protein [Rhodovulum sp. YEN HP10]|uniref:hypothetical protein n=1 Tax=Rhodovulum sp. HP10 TaxID=3387397 RepID=UPI0039E0E81B